jgi:hypothetical protein
MKKNIITSGAALLLCQIASATTEQPDPGATQAASPAAPTSTTSDAAVRADKRYDEMLGKMQSAVEEIAQLYGNPVFLQVFTNDIDRAAQLKDRLRSARSGDDLKKELADLQKKRDELLNDIALREREAARLTNKLVRQRAALDGLADAVDQARKAVEETAK